jgi:DNA topoisomerase-1
MALIDMASDGATELPAGLVFVTAEDPGLLRRGRKRFRYVDADGGEVDDPEELARIGAVAIPPAWTDVWICADPNGHLQAVGRDARGRKQYCYHPLFRADREQAKFDQLVDFGRRLGKLRAALEADLDRRGMPFERVVALVVALLERTRVRVGNESYLRDNGTYGLTTLGNRHVRVEGARLELRFVGKGGKAHRKACTDKRLARLVRKCQELPGQTLFSFVGDDGLVHCVRSGDVNDYLRSVTGLSGATAKTFRTWGATVEAACLLAEVEPPTTARAAKRTIKAVMTEVSEQLGNTPTVCRASYVHPRVVDAYQDGSLQAHWKSGPKRPKKGLTADERRLLLLLKEPPTSSRQ